jgi:hypothetical protein
MIETERGFNYQKSADNSEDSGRKLEENSRDALAKEIARKAERSGKSPLAALIDGIVHAVRSTIPASGRVQRMPTPEDFKKHNLEREQNLRDEENKKPDQA